MCSSTTNMWAASSSNCYCGNPINTFKKRSASLHSHWGCYNPLLPIIRNHYYADFHSIFVFFWYTQSSGDISNPTKESEIDISEPQPRLFVPSKSSDSSIRLRFIGATQSDYPKEERRYGAGVATRTSDHEEQWNNETTDKSIWYTACLVKECNVYT